jgi:hypothetical protein
VVVVEDLEDLTQHLLAAPAPNETGFIIATERMLKHV